MIDRRNDSGPFDIIGDVHGCYNELNELLDALGYRAVDNEFHRLHPDGRRVIFLGDIIDRGPGIVEALRLAMTMVAAGSALCVLGNHEDKLYRKLSGRNVKISHGLAQTLAQIAMLPADAVLQFEAQVREFLGERETHLRLAGGDLIAAHAGLSEELHERSDSEARAFALYGPTTGEIDDHGYPVRYDWARDYHGRAKVVYGHVPTAEPTWINNTLCIDTGCVYGGALTALRYPEFEQVRIPAHARYTESPRPFR